MEDLKASLIDLGKTFPELRPHLRQILAANAFQELFGEIRSLLQGKASGESYSKLIKILGELYAQGAQETERKVLPYVKSILDRSYSDKLRTFDENDLKLIGNATNKMRVLLGKIYTGKYLPPKAFESREIAEIVFRVDMVNIRGVKFSTKSVVTSQDIMEFLKKHGTKLSWLEASGFDFPSNFFKQIGKKNIPSMNLNIEGSPQINFEEVLSLNKELGDDVISADDPNEGFMSNSETYMAFHEGLQGLFDGEFSVNVGGGRGVFEVHGMFGNDIRSNEDYGYQIVVQALKSETSSHVQVDLNVSLNSKVFFTKKAQVKRPKADRKDTGYNRHVQSECVKLSKILFDAVQSRLKR